jgi:hypothetical protein
MPGYRLSTFQKTTNQKLYKTFFINVEFILLIFVTDNSFLTAVYDHHDGSGAQSPNPRREKGTLLLKFLLLAFFFLRSSDSYNHDRKVVQCAFNEKLGKILFIK